MNKSREKGNKIIIKGITGRNQISKNIEQPPSQLSLLFFFILIWHVSLQRGDAKQVSRDGFHIADFVLYRWFSCLSFPCPSHVKVDIFFFSGLPPSLCCMPAVLCDEAHSHKTPNPGSTSSSPALVSLSCSLFNSVIKEVLYDFL